MKTEEKYLTENKSGKETLVKKINILLAQEMEYGVITNQEWRALKASIKKVLKVK